MTQILAQAAALLLFGGQAAGAEVLTLDEALDVAVNSSYSVRIAALEAKKSDEQVDAAKANLGPDVTLQANHARIWQSSPSGVSGSSGGGGGFVFGGPDQQTLLNLTATQSIDISNLSGAALAAAKYRRNAATFAAAVELNTVKQIVRQKYFSILQARDQIDVQQREVAAAEERLRNGQLFLQKGSIPKFDVLRLEADLARAQQALVAAERNFRLAKQDLNNTLGRPIDTPYRVVPPEMDDFLIGAKAEEYTDAALRLRPEILQVQSTILALEELKTVETAGTKPGLAVSLNHQYNPDPFFGQSANTTTLAANFSWTLYDAGRTAAAVRAAQRDIELAILSLEQAQLGISFEVRNALVQLETSLRLLESAAESEEAAEEALRLAQLRFDAGEGILIDVLAAQAELTRARSATVAARYQVMNAYGLLQKAVGTDDIAGALDPELPDPAADGGGQ